MKPSGRTFLLRLRSLLPNDADTVSGLCASF
jgi:hypothetical protein